MTKRVLDVNQSRRSFLLRAGVGLGTLSLAELLGDRNAWAARDPQNVGALGAPHFAPRAKRVIQLHMLGAISHVDTMDYKPMLEKMHGQEMPESVRSRGRLSTMSAGQSAFTVLGPLARFKQRGQSGAWISDLLPYTAGIADDLCFIKTMNTEHVNHDPASKFLHTGFQLSGRPSAGAWVSYALGSDNQDLPNYIVMNSGINQGVPQDAAIWGSGFLPSHHQGVMFRSGDEPVLYLSNPEGTGARDRRELLDALGKLAGVQQTLSNDPDILSRVSQYEMAYRMQASVPEVPAYGVPVRVGAVWSLPVLE